MYSSRTRKFYNVLQIDGNDALTPEQIELMKNYDGIVFTSPTFNQSIDCIPCNIKYIDMSAIKSFQKPFKNLPASLIGIAFPNNIHANNSAQDLLFIPHGIKVMYFTSKYVPADFHTFLPELPSSLEYVIINDKLYNVDMNYHEVKKILKNDVHTIKSHIIFDIPFDYKYNYPIGY